MDDKRCNNYGFIKCSSCRYAIHCKYGVHGKPFCQNDAISRFFSIYLCTGLFSHGTTGGKTGRAFYLHDTSRHRFSNNGKLVFIAVLHRYRLNMRSRFMETWSLSKSAPACGKMIIIITHDFELMVACCSSEIVLEGEMFKNNT